MPSLPTPFDNTHISVSHKTAAAVLFTYLTFRMRLELPSESLSFPSSLVLNTLYSFRKFEVKDLFLLAGFLLIYALTENCLPRERKGYVLFPSLLFAFFMVFGFSFETADSWVLAVGIRNGQLPKALLFFLRWLLLFYHLISALFQAMDRSYAGLSRRPAAKVPFSGSLRADNRFRTVFIILLIGFLPRIITAYPAAFMGDTQVQVQQAFPELHYVWGVSEANLLSDSVFITQHHPVAHTLFLHWCLVIGDKVFHSFNIGVFLYTVLQNLFLFLTVSTVITVLSRKMSLGRKAVLTLTLYYIVHPLIHFHVSLLTKDVIYTCFFILFMLSMFFLLENMPAVSGRKVHISLALFSIGMAMFRNEARYVIILSFLIILVLLKPVRKEIAAHLGVFLVFSFLYFSVLMSALHFTKGSIREMLSVPFQQTARYVKYNGDDVTEEEHRAIAAVLDYDSLAERYNPNLSDPVKRWFNEDASREDLRSYFHAWFLGLRKRPGTYIQATMNNYYQFFYPGKCRLSRNTLEWSGEQIDIINKKIEPLGKQFSLPDSLAGLRKLSDALNSFNEELPILSFLLIPALYTWSFILMAVYSLRTGNRRQFLLLVPILASQLCFLLGPANGYYGRYSFPSAVFLPFCLLMFILSGMRRDEDEERTL